MVCPISVHINHVPLFKYNCMKIGPHTEEGKQTGKTMRIKNKQTNNKEKEVDKNLLFPATGMGFFVIFFLGAFLALAAASSTYKSKKKLL